MQVQDSMVPIISYTNKYHYYSHEVDVNLPSPT